MQYIHKPRSRGRSTRCGGRVEGVVGEGVDKERDEGGKEVTVRTAHTRTLNNSQRRGERDGRDGGNGGGGRVFGKGEDSW